MNPECRAGKHSNCDGNGWRDDLGRIGPCLCGCHDPTRPAWKVEMTADGPKVIPPASERAFGPEFDVPRCPNCDAPLSRVHSPACPRFHL